MPVRTPFDDPLLEANFWQESWAKLQQQPIVNWSFVDASRIYAHRLRLQHARSFKRNG